MKGGNDDLRQDAIMEQVFQQVSQLLHNNYETRRRKLSIRTYKVIPLSNRSGILEFVPHSVAFNEYVVPAHEHYYPQDWKNSVCRKTMSGVLNSTRKDRVETFDRVLHHFHPVLRYFFLEKYPSPDEWYTCRLAYARSTAAISVLGYVLGLGDRHGQNILLDEHSGEVVHIDLGVAFEQVIFRL